MEFDPRANPRWLGDEVEQSDSASRVEELSGNIQQIEALSRIFAEPAWPAFETRLRELANVKIRRLVDTRLDSMEEVEGLRGEIRVLREILDMQRNDAREIAAMRDELETLDRPSDTVGL